MGDRVRLSPRRTVLIRSRARGPRWFTIAPTPFVATSPAACTAACRCGPQALATRWCAPCPPRRASLAEAFLDAAGGAGALPHPRAGRPRRGRAAVRAGRPGLDLPPRLAAAPPLRAGAAGGRARRARARAGRGRRWSWPTRWAASSTALQIEESWPRGRRPLVEGELARHWRSRPTSWRSRSAWPRRLAELGLMDVASGACGCCGRWPSAGTPSRRSEPLVAAGSTGTAPGHRRPAGRDRRGAAGLRGAAGPRPRPGRRRLGEVGEQHPQGAMKRLLERPASSAPRCAPWPRRRRPASARAAGGGG